MNGTKSGKTSDHLPTQDTSSLGSWLKQRRTTLDMTQAALAMQAGCSVRTIRQLEANGRRPSRQLAERLALALGLSQTLWRPFMDFARGRQPTAPSMLQESAMLAEPALCNFASIPVPPNKLIGRAEDIKALVEMLMGPEVRLLSLVGPPGVGKTRLAIALAACVASEFRAGVCFVELAPVQDGTQVLPTVAAALGLREDGSQALSETLIASLGNSQMLLVLDNFEQVSAAAPAVARLLARSPMLKVLVTSRTVLHVGGEQTYRVPPLALPKLSLEAAPESLSALPAVTLFVQRACAVRHDLHLDQEQIRTIAELCVRLDGLPLAIELAAARLNVLSPQALLQRLDQRLDLLQRSAVDANTRHQTLRGAILWSHDLLTGRQQVVFRRLGVFAGGCTLEAAQAVCGEAELFPYDSCSDDQANPNHLAHFLDDMAVLVDHSLVQQTIMASGEVRFTMLESLRSFATEQLETSGELLLVRSRHANYYLHWAEQALPWLHYPDQQTMDMLEAEQENFRTAMAWSLTHQSGDTLALRLTLALYPYWHVRGYLSEGRQWLLAAIARSAEAQSVLLARAQALVAELARLQDDYCQAETWAKSSWTLGQALEDAAAIATALVPLGWVDHRQNNLTSARQRFEASLRLFRVLEKPAQIARVLHDLAYLAMVQGNYVEALTYYEEELALSSDSDHQQGVFWALHGMAWVAEREGDMRRAAHLYNRCLVMARALRHADGLALALVGLGAVARAESKFAQATVYYQESERLWRRLGRKIALSLVLQEQGTVALDRGDVERAAHYFSESLMLEQDVLRARSLARSQLGLVAVACAIHEYLPAVRLLGAITALLDSSHQVLEVPERQLYDQAIAEARTNLDPKTFNEAWQTGYAFPLKQAIAEAFQVADTARSTIPENLRTPFPAGLTLREVEVLRLVAQGLTNAQIAANLIISRGTVNAHLTSLYRKLNTSSRATATRFAVEHGLV